MPYTVDYPCGCRKNQELNEWGTNGGRHWFLCKSHSSLISKQKCKTGYEPDIWHSKSDKKKVDDFYKKYQYEES